MEITWNPVACRERYSNQGCSGHLARTGDVFRVMFSIRGGEAGGVRS